MNNDILIKKWKDERMRIIDADEVIKYYKNIGKEFPELSVGVHFSINDIIDNLDNIDTVKLGGKTAMTKYSEIEIQTAKNLLEHDYKWIVRYESGRLFAHCDKPIKVNNIWGSFGDSVCVGKFVPIFQNIRFGDKEPVSLEAIVHPHILDDAEKRYLSAVIRPFRSDVTSISKNKALTTEREQINISIRGYNGACLPWYDAGTMYRGMEPERLYTLKELGL